VTTEKALVIKAKGGLGNRMLSAVTGIVLAQLNDRTPYIDWRDGMYVAPGDNLYPYLFEAGWMGDLASFDNATQVAPSVWSGRMIEHPTNIIHREYPNKHSDPLIYRKLSIDLVGPDPAETVGVFWSYLPKLKRLEQRMARHPEFRGRDLSDITSDCLDHYFRPVAEVRERVDAIFNDLRRPIIGVHIRFTDRKVPLPKIIASLAKLKSDMPEARIFLATDSAEAQAAVLARFPDAQTIEKALASNGAALHVAAPGFSDPVAEARNALIDMIALSRCDFMVHSSHSTFSVTAALIGRIPEANQIDVDRFNAKVIVKQFIQARV
jgi:hypothetical protein